MEEIKEGDLSKQSIESQEKKIREGQEQKMIVENSPGDVESRTSQKRQNGEAVRRMLSQKTSISSQSDALFLAVKSLDTNKVMSIL